MTSTTSYPDPTAYQVVCTCHVIDFSHSPFKLCLEISLSQPRTLRSREGDILGQSHTAGDNAGVLNSCESRAYPIPSRIPRLGLSPSFVEATGVLRCWNVFLNCRRDYYNFYPKLRGSKMLAIELLNVPAIPFLGIYSKEMKTYVYILVFIAALFIIAKS